MKAALTVIFEYYGEIVEIVAKSSLKRKGQAFVVFNSEKSCLDAVEDMDGFELFGKFIRVARAKTHSDETIKRKAPDMFEEHKRKRLTQKGMCYAFYLIMCALRLQTTDFKRAQEDAKAQANPAATAEKPRAKPGAAALIPDEYVRPNKTLFVQNIPYETEESDLTAIFERFEGFKEVRYVKLRAVAFVEFENEQYSITAKEQTADARVGKDQKPLKVSYQRA